MRANNNIVTFKGGKEIFVEPTLFLNDSRAMAECAIQGLGIVKLHDYIVDPALKNGELIEIFPEFCEPKQVVYLYYQQSRYLLPKIRRFIDFYERFFADSTGRLV
jgi:DNA-binding transcriptional LysR family regulator